ncbi:alpha-glucan phosphorylase [Fischerella thermalis CCMEE 5205]|uniref:Alpha-glucan phosphorylase n=1 Tax=Fischerella thermalis CCMEE 5318 TaxID=2019666 RepID=A0A2N6LEE9_9CYAN|nr:alpha-glucan family phosphorylase [Fischerella thermalis]PMB21699.1 alpha-glucan phosphorylase [Fischerella thermalis CCMEE 5318]PMB28886.1 alpha-glucan phosphorylase [Fischerella thermalis CCMEE 5319]PMB42657.1 alpha-glucan phosphorylase [Fischerella thermalis CCMEE 5205]
MTKNIAMTAALRLSEKLPLPLRRLADLAYNYWWSWTSDRIALFQTIDPQEWERCGHNPVAILESATYERLTQLAEDPFYLKQISALAKEFDEYMTQKDTWVNRVAPQVSIAHPIAYFCAEFGIHESLPIYSGGLGILAGDHLKSSSDLGVPMVGVGLLYRQGYFRQRLNRSGWQEDYYVDNPFHRMPIELIKNEQGQPLTIEIQIRQRRVKVQIWQVQIGRVTLYLLDSDREDNDPIDRWLTAHLYGGNQETRIAQEVVLGIGGVRALTALGIQPSVYHLNEGHAAFCTLEISRQEIERTNKSFYDIEADVRQRCVFTTHTPVPAGHDVFSPDLIDSFFAHYWPQLRLSREQFLALGARRLGDPWEPFGMTVLALRMCRTSNGVSELHGRVSRQMWTVMYPNRSEDNVPIGYITNGVHAPTWTAPLIAELYSQYLGTDWKTRAVDPKMWEKVDDIPNEELWWRHQILKERLIAHTRHKVKKAREARGEEYERIQATDTLLNPQALTIGFARRFSPYKRGHLLLRDTERALRIFGNTDRPVQIIFAGKAHPADEEGKRIIQRLMEWCKHPALTNRVAFIEDYDIYTAQKLVQGVDVWLNNPRRPLEASGTSGQKVCFNGGINCSVLDGWWCEGYQADANGKGINGWAIGEDAHTSDQELQDRIDSESLYQLLEQEITPLYYNQDANGIPHGWIQMMKASIKTNAPLFNTDRMIADYVSQVYVPEIAVTVPPILAKVLV